MIHNHIVVDANLLIDYLHPRSCNSPRLAERLKVLFQSTLVARWPDIRLYIPAIAVAEVLAALDKYRYCTWTGPVKRDASLKLSPSEHRQVVDTFLAKVTTRACEQIDHEPSHIPLVSLLSPINHKYKYRRGAVDGKRVKRPMGASDCVIAAAAILLGSRVGGDRARLLTSDQRLADVVSKCRKLSPRRAEVLGLPEIARGVGLEWSPTIYPEAVNLRTASIQVLRKTFGGWPLPDTTLRRVSSRSDFSARDDVQLINEWLATAACYRLRNVDNLPYHPAIQDLRTRLACTAQIDVPTSVLFRRLVSLRKQGKLPTV